MTKWADFVVSAIKKGSGLSNISHVQIHEDLEHGFGHPELIDKYQLSSKIQNGISFVTVHKKNENEWTIGKTIRTYVKNGEAYIRTDDNKVDGDNLGHMPLVDELEIVFAEVKKEEPTPTPKSIPEPIPEPEPEPEPIPEPEPEPVKEEPISKINENDGDYEYEDSRRETLAKEAQKVNSKKSMPENWTDKPKEVSHWNEDGTFNSSFKKEQKKEFLEYEKEYLEQFEKGKSKSKKLKEK